MASNRLPSSAASVYDYGDDELAGIFDDPDRLEMAAAAVMLTPSHRAAIVRNCN